MENRSLINCTVIHKNKYGVGKVIEHEAGKVVVQFKADLNNFYLPRCF